MRILIDTNIIIDLVQNREPHSDNASRMRILDISRLIHFQIYSLF